MKEGENGSWQNFHLMRWKNMYKGRTEENWVKLWKTFFTAIAIEERKNPNCQRNHLPLRFRDLMTEFQ